MYTIYHELHPLYRLYSAVWIMPIANGTDAQLRVAMETDLAGVYLGAN